ncbi:hypothetical protein BUALT_Bualt08G0118200 [Buddleja alternifolia]|uniref:Aldehyde dehydrogenase n=1 Tax=Buddleja alternifolia TaxID=168488 RepID=A0AAV6X527_9LAMI|nr:hypothetical protein BUALT_Bualt08G0118200 [Buddleja alternifolia]
MALGVGMVATEMRFTFAGGKTRTTEWRFLNLSFILQIARVISSCKLDLKELHRWMKPEKVKTTMSTYPSSAEIDLELSYFHQKSPLPRHLCFRNSWGNTWINGYLSVKVVEGGVPETTALLDQKWDKIFYTGNTKVGRIILAAAAKHLTPVVLELGGKCPLVVDSNTNLKVTARRIIVGKWGSNSGQTCVSPDYVISTKAFASKLVDAISSELEKFYGKDPLQSNDMPSIINSRHFERLTNLLEDDKVSGKIVIGGQWDKANLKIAPTVVLDVSEDSLIMKEEIFGPLLPIVTVNEIEDSIRVINAKEKALAAYLFTNDKKLKEEFIRSVSAGGMSINETTLHLAERTLPFGGVGESGMGSYHGKFSFDAFSHKKSVLIRGFSGDIAARYPPYTHEKLNFLKAMLSGNIFRILRALIGW